MFQFFHILTNIYNVLIFFIMTIIIWICISIMIIEVEQCLLAVRMSFLKKKYLLRLLPNVYLVYFAIEPLKEFLIYFGYELLIRKWFANIFLHSLSCLFMLLVLLLYGRFLMRCTAICWFLLLLPVLLFTNSGNHCEDQSYEVFLTYFLLWDS